MTYSRPLVLCADDANWPRVNRSRKDPDQLSESLPQVLNQEISLATDLAGSALCRIVDNFTSTDQIPCEPTVQWPYSAFLNRRCEVFYSAS